MQTDLPEDTIVYADSRMFETVLRNLLSNAVKYTPYGGRISIGSRDRNGLVQLDVTDTGVGMDEGQLTHLFKVEKKASRPGTNNEQGTGFGLILCREFVKKNGGELTVKSTAGKGSTFSFTVPRGRKR
jgi:signal transduction histidine kinase